MQTPLLVPKDMVIKVWPDIGSLRVSDICLFILLKLRKCEANIKILKCVNLNLSSEIHKHFCN